MHLKDAMFAWTPLRDDWLKTPKVRAGAVWVGPAPDSRSETSGLVMSTGAVFSHWRTLSDDERFIAMMLEFHTMVVRDLIDPKAAHQEFLKIDEYRQRISRDIDGAEDEPETANDT
jgi:hypothetical protein